MWYLKAKVWGLVWFGIAAALSTEFGWDVGIVLGLVITVVSRLALGAFIKMME